MLHESQKAAPAREPESEKGHRQSPADVRREALVYEERPMPAVEVLLEKRFHAVIVAERPGAINSPLLDAWRCAVCRAADFAPRSGLADAPVVL